MFVRIILLIGILNDSDDDMVIECALVSNASYIMTGDKHLLSLVKYQDIKIAKAADFVNLFS